jgi:DNA repair exonuclease SbcCD ATPase subunit
VTGLPPRRGPVGPPPAGEGAATREDLRSLRRWVIVAGVWAVAATAIALIALLDSSEGDARKEADAARNRAVATERKLDRRIDDLEERLEALPRSDDVSRLQQRLSKAETGATKAAADARSAESKLSDLEKRVQTVEDDADRAGAGDDGADGGDSP